MTLSDCEERVTERQLNKLAPNIGADWESLARDLGLKDSEVFACKANNQLSVRSQIFAMLMKWRAKAGKDATVMKLVQKLREFGTDEDAFSFLLPSKQSETGLVKAVPPVEPEPTARASVDPRLILLWQQASAIVRKTHPGVDFTPDPSGGRKEQERVLKIKEWEAPLKERVENYSSSIGFSIDCAGGGMKRVDFCAVVGVDDVTSQALALLGPPDRPQSWPEERLDMSSYQTSVMFEGSSGSPGFSKHGNAVLLHTRGFRPYSNQPSIVEMGVLLSSVKENARVKLSNDVNVFNEIFGS
ncbi:CRADD [Branchiostoma lanceolatum]|uniref:CRADD protein n=1 Tax=Branchiostoma lanceolatum TaxID=7740 RepID=A0A8K0A0N4_BRALA|nr:CRADD [Branchiostoma lanceolatum]